MSDQVLQADWLREPGVQKVFALLADAGHQIFAVGGCVRNSLMGLGATDIDFATDATPEAVMTLAKNAGLRAVPTGIEHGTVTLVIDGAGFEVTTFRKDVATDGRRAVVAFAADPTTDSLRRDFTMNAIYADRAGLLFDPQDGIKDAKARRVRFIGDPAKRINEDALRILRFFRFFAQLGDSAQGFDAEGLAACAQYGDLIDGLSAERITAEMQKLLSAADPAPAVAAMVQSGVMGHVVAGADAAILAVLVHLEDGMKPDWHRRLAAISASRDFTKLRLSKASSQRLKRTFAALDDLTSSPMIAGYLFGETPAKDAALIRAAAIQSPLSPQVLDQITQGAAKKFPLSAADLMPEFEPGPDLGKALKKLEKIWIASEFTLSKQQLLQKL